MLKAAENCSYKQDTYIFFIKILSPTLLVHGSNCLPNLCTTVFFYTCIVPKFTYITRTKYYSGTVPYIPYDAMTAKYNLARNVVLVTAY